MKHQDIRYKTIRFWLQVNYTSTETRCGRIRTRSSSWFVWQSRQLSFHWLRCRRKYSFLSSWCQSVRSHSNQRSSQSCWSWKDRLSDEISNASCVKWTQRICSIVFIHIGILISSILISPRKDNFCFMSVVFYVFQRKSSLRQQVNESRCEALLCITSLPVSHEYLRGPTPFFCYRFSEYILFENFSIVDQYPCDRNTFAQLLKELPFFTFWCYWIDSCIANAHLEI